VDHTNCPDTPVLGRYNSSDINIIKQHIAWFKELGIDFLIISWWGKDSHSDLNAKILLNEVVANKSDLKFFIMIEPFTGGWDEAYNTTTGVYNYTLIYKYIYDNYVTPYKSQYMNMSSFPVLAVFKEVGSTNFHLQEDSRFTMRIVGADKDTNWEMQVPELTQQPVCIDGEINIMPRYDAHGWKDDITYSEGLYDKMWNRAIGLAKEGSIHMVTIASWNEFAERTQIEPTNDTTSFTSSPYYLFEKTRMYINIIKSTEPEPFPTLWVVAAVAIVATGGAASAIYYFTKKPRRIGNNSQNIQKT
jgi:hypothetical protein